MDEVAEVASKYFMNIFKASTCDKMEECLNTADRKITDAMLARDVVQAV